MPERSHDCDVLLNQNYFGQISNNLYVNQVPSSTHCLIGPSFALLQPEYATLHEEHVSLAAGDIRRILVFFGNSDLMNKTGQLLEALGTSEFSHLVIDVVVGSNYSDIESLKLQFKRYSNITFLL